MKILLCEDQDAIRHMMETLVGASGHEVTAVDSGPRAVEAALKERYDVLLLDLMMPGMDGFAVCEHLRAAPETRDLPIVVITAADDPETRERVLAAGASAFYGKPFSPIGLLADLQRMSDAVRR